MSANIENDKRIVEAHDDAVSHIFGAGLSLSAILSLDRVDNEIADRLREALASLDSAVADLRTAAFAHLNGTSKARREPRDPPPVQNGHRRLCLVTANEVFAYAVGHDFHRAADHELWAHESDGLLLSARHGTPLARRVGNVFYDVATNAPLYHEDRPASLDDGGNAVI